MKNLLALAAVAAVALVPSFAKAEDTHAAAKVETPAAAVSTETTTETTTTETTAVEAREATLKDGTKISIEGDKVFVVAADGTKTPAPDAEHELADGTKVKTVAGVIVK